LGVSRPTSSRCRWSALAVEEIRVRDASGAYRVIYTARLADAIYVLHAFRKKTQAEAAKQCGISQPRMNDLLRGRISRFSLDALVDSATALGCRVRLELRAA
jgi:predicted XRE-type DNA-binding protein